MKRSTTLLLLMGLLLVEQAAAHKPSQDEDFGLTIHITAVDMQQGQSGVSGRGSTDSNGNYSSNVSGGESYTWHLYTAHIEGDNKTYGLSTRIHYKGGKVLAAATLGWSAAVTSRRIQLHIGDYRGHWNNDGTLEIRFPDQKGGLIHQPFRIESERAEVLPIVAPNPVPAPSVAPVAYQQQNEVHIESAAQSTIQPTTQPAPQPVRTEESLGDAARSAKQRKACLELARDNPSITCK